MYQSQSYFPKEKKTILIFIILYEYIVTTDVMYGAKLNPINLVVFKLLYASKIPKKVTLFSIEIDQFKFLDYVIINIAMNNGHSSNIIDNMIRIKLYKLCVKNISIFRNKTVNYVTKFLSVL